MKLLNAFIFLAFLWSAHPTWGQSIFFKPGKNTDSVTISTPSLSHSLLLKNPRNTPLTIDAEVISLDNLADDSFGFAVAGSNEKHTQATLIIPPRGLDKLLLKANLSKVDDYNFYVVLTYPRASAQSPRPANDTSAQATQARPVSASLQEIKYLKVTRNRSTVSSPLLVRGAQNILATSFARLGWIPISATLIDSLQATEHTIQGWNITRLQRTVSKNDLAVDAPFRSVITLTDEGDTLLPGSKSIQVPAGGSVQLKQYIEGLRAGKYTGTLELETIPHSHVRHGFTMYVRNPAWMAFLLILLGVTLSYLINRYQTKFRPTLDIRRRLGLRGAEINNRLKLSLRTFEKEILLGFLDEIRILDQSLSAQDANTSQNTVKMLRLKIGLFDDWVKARMQIDKLPASYRTEFYDQLKSKAAAWQYNLVEEAQVNQERQFLTNIKEKLLPLNREVFQKKLTQWQETLDQQMERMTDETLQQDLLQLKEGKLAEVNELIGTDIDAARASFDQLRLDYVGILGQDLTNYMDAVVPTGYAEGDESWTALKKGVHEHIDKIQATLDPDKALDAYEEGYEMYLTAVTEKLRVHAVKAAEDGIPEEWDVVNQNLEKIEVSLKNKDFSAAAALYDETQKLCADLEGSDRSGDIFDMIEDPSPAVMTPVQDTSMVREGLELPQAPEAEEEAYVLPDAATISRQISTYDLILAGVALLLATFMGLNLLYETNYTWGSANDYLIAILWGLGLHQVTGQAFKATGVGDNLKQFIQTSPGGNGNPAGS